MPRSRVVDIFHACFLLLFALDVRLSRAFQVPSSHDRRCSASASATTNAVKFTKLEVAKQPISSELSRRGALEASGAALLSLTLGTTNEAIAASPQQPSRPKTILITGSNSGVGFEAAKLLTARDEGGQTLILACRTLAKANDAIDRIRESVQSSSVTLIPAECNLASLDSIKRFVQELSVGTLDVICLNAGVALNVDDKQVQRTADGFELTVGTNHFGHFYLNHLLLNKINRDTGRIVVTASSVHDPESPGGAQGRTATLGNLEGLTRDGRNFEMVDGNPYNGDKAYKDSKLCNVLFTRELQRRLASDASTKNVVANCFSPGLITSTGLFRNQNPLFSKAFDVLATNVAKVAESPKWGGGSLAYMTSVTTRGEFYTSPPGSSKYGEEAYGREFAVSNVSKEAEDDAKAKKLWDITEKLLGIST